MQRGTIDSAGIQNADGKNKEHISPGQEENEEKGIHDPKENGGMHLPCFIQTERHVLKKFRADINNQDRQKSTVQTDRQTGTKKIVPHDDDLDQHTGHSKAIVHGRIAPSPEGAPSVVIQAISLQTQFDCTTVTYY